MFNNLNRMARTCVCMVSLALVAVTFAARDATAQTVNLITANASNTAAGNGASYRPSLSADGRYVAFQSTSSDLVANDNNNVDDVFVRDL